MTCRQPWNLVPFLMGHLFHHRQERPKGGSRRTTLFQEQHKQGEGARSITTDHKKDADLLPFCFSASTWPAPPPTWGSDVPAWAQQQPPPPTSAQSWTYGQQYPSFTPMSGYGAPTPAGSWGATTPGSYGPPTPASANGHAAASPWVHAQQAQGYYPPAAQESSFGQPITASPWFNGSGGGSGGFAGFGGGFGGGGGSVKKKSKRKSTQDGHQPFLNVHDPLNLDLVRSTSHDMMGGAGYPLRRSLSFGAGGTMYPHSPYQQGQQAPQSEEYNSRNLARRPRDWRPDYDARPGLAAFMPRVGRNRSDITGVCLSYTFWSISHSL